PGGRARPGRGVGRVPGPACRPHAVPRAVGRGAFDRQWDGRGGVQDGDRPAAEADRGAVARAPAGADGGAVLPGLRRPVRRLTATGGRLATSFRYRTPWGGSQ